jgi:hypothetical protein
MSEPALPGEAFAAVDDELKRLAAARLTRESPDHALDATTPVPEVDLRLGERPGASAQPSSSSSPTYCGGLSPTRATTRG